MEQAIQQLKADSADAVNHAGFALTYGAMAVCGLAIVLGITARGAWLWLSHRARTHQSVRRILRDPKRRMSEAGDLAHIRRAGL
jgi:hypothetical protein